MRLTFIKLKQYNKKLKESSTNSKGIKKSGYTEK
jgi:hypothetical protein